MIRTITVLVPPSMLVRLRLALADAHTARANAALRRWALRFERPSEDTIRELAASRLVQ